MGLFVVPTHGTFNILITNVFIRGKLHLIRTSVVCVLMTSHCLCVLIRAHDDTTTYDCITHCNR